MRFLLVRSRFLLVLSFFLMGCSLWAQVRQSGIVDIPGRPGFDEAVFANGMLVVSHNASDTVDVFDPARRRIVAQVPDMAGPHGLAVDPHRERVYVGNSRGNSVSVLSSKDWKLQSTIKLNAPPYNLTLAPDGAKLFVANWRNRSITRIDLDSGEQLTAEIQGSPQALVFDQSRKLLFATLQDTAEVIAVDPASLKVVSRYKITASQPTAMVLNPATRRLYVAVRNAVVILDADNGTEAGRVAAPLGADSMWLDAAGNMLYMASGGGYINVFRTNGGLIPLQEIRTEVRGQTLAFDPSRNLLYLPGGREGRSKLLILRQTMLPASEGQGQEQVAVK